MDKPRFRYNHKTESWDELYRFNTDYCVISQVRRPDGSFNSFPIPRASLLGDHYSGRYSESLRQVQRKYNMDMSLMVEKAEMGKPYYGGDAINTRSEILAVYGEV